MINIYTVNYLTSVVNTRVENGLIDGFPNYLSLLVWLTSVTNNCVIYRKGHAALQLIVRMMFSSLTVCLYSMLHLIPEKQQKYCSPIDN